MVGLSDDGHWLFTGIRATKKPLHEEEAIESLIPRLLSSYLSGIPAGVGTFLPLPRAARKGCRVSSGQSLHHSG